ncbi:MAG TPA: choice-of-anchor Q domain-containing protein [Pyrinomonadaceae bacterium]|nr:choice-of-anchor Q domain-containing protein [Pyrinomonadaceae bacterium]
MKTIPHLSPTRRFCALALLAAVPFFVWMFTAKSEPAPFFAVHPIVTTLADADDANLGDGVCDVDAAVFGPQCSLRAAIQEANVLFGDNTISFNPGLTGVISLNTPLPDLNANVALVGPGANVIAIERSTAPGTPNFRLFTITTGRVVSIANVTLRNGRTTTEGGAISNRGTLTVTSSVLTNNSTDFGGAIFTQGNLTIIDSTLSQNNVGGAIFMSSGIGKFLNSTISNNTSTNAGAGFSFTGFSSGTIVNCTITGNRTDVFGTTGTKGGGIAKGNVNFVELRNTIVTGNKRDAGAIPDDILGTVSAASTSNLIGVGGGLTDGVNNNHVGVSNPGLGALADNGGPTKTHRLLPGSPAIDAGNNCVLNDSCFPFVGMLLSNDQRGAGFSRFVNGDFDETPRVDIGAYEAQSVLQNPPFVVTNTNDSGAGSLRQAIVDASVNGGGNVITFQPGLTGTISLATPLPDLDSSVIIKGPGADKLTVQRSNAGGTPFFRIFTITAGHTVRISGLMIANGSAQGGTLEDGSGGGIFNQGSLFLDGCVITGNQAGIGGGIASNGALRMLNSTVANNTATADGGGISNNSVFALTGLRIEGSTISNNVSGDRGGGLFNSGAPSSVITNTTISTNSAVSGGGMFSLDDTALRNVTITANHASTRGGGIGLHFNAIRFSNTIVAGNTSPLGPDGHSEFDFTNFISDDYNLIGNTSGMQITGVVTHNLHNVNPRLGPLAANGGPTKTHELLDGSLAIDAGASTVPADQRGLPRRVDYPSAPNIPGDLSDIGAFEAHPFEVNTTSDTDDGACTLAGSGNGCSLREAINAANNTVGTQTITFSPALTAAGPSAITLFSVLPDLNSDLSIVGPGADLLTVQRSSAAGTPDFRIFKINSTTTVTISGLTVANGRIGSGDARGAGVFNSGQLTLSDCNLYGNTLGFNGLGGGVYNQGPSLTLINCKVGGVGPGQSNFATASGGGIFNAATLLVKGGSIVGNGGDGIASNGATATLDGVSITNNTETGGGGAGVRLVGGNTRIINCLVANNISTGTFGGGLMNGAGANTIVINSTFSGNTSTGDGGGIVNFNATLTLINATVTNNRADSDDNSFGGENGGGVAGLGGTLLMHNSIVAGNVYRAGANEAANDAADGIHTPSSFNVIGVCDFCGLSNGVNNNLIGVANAGLAPLANNGGPTLTHALLPASPALDRGNNALVEQPALNGPPFNDQRGVPFSRVVDGPDGDTTATVDAGAFEQQGSLVRIQDTKTSEDTPLLIPFDVGDRSLITSITATSSNDTLVPNDADHLSLTELGSTELITINPAADRSGTSNITVNVNRTGNSESHTFNVTVNPVNDAPTFTPGLSQNHDEDAGAFSIPWASNISAGPPDESGQTLTFQITGNSNTTLFASQPTIPNESGIIQYQLKPNANGVAFLTVVLKDNGGTANGGKDTSIAQTFVITINAINDPPATRFPPFAQNVIENGTLTFSNPGGNPIALLDVDLGIAPLQVTVKATNGLFTLNGTSGLSFTVGNGQANTTMTFSGSLASINAALEGSRFTPNASYDGPAQVQIISNDGGATGFGGPQSDNETIFINVLNGGALQFQSSSHAVSESMNKATITVNRVGGTAGAASVTYSTSGGTATGGGVCGAGIDYIDTTGTLSWAAGDATAKTFEITVCDDSLDELDEVLNIALSAPQGSGQVGSPATSTLTLLNDDAPVLLTEENTDHAIALDSVVQTRDPFSLFTPHNFSNDHRRRVSLFVWRLGLQPNDNLSNVTFVAEDSAGTIYPLTVEFIGGLPDLPGVTQVIVILPDNVIGAPRDLWLTVKVRGPGSNRAFIRIAAP